MDNDRVIPIALTNVAWQQYLSISKEILGRSVSKGVDASTSKLSDFAKYSASLAEFQLGKEVDARSVLRHPGPWAQHTFYSFLILTSSLEVLRIAESTSLDVISTKAEKQRLAVVSGTLAAWRDAVIICCSQDNSTRLRFIFNEVKHTFDQLGLNDIWFEYRAEKHQDGTFYLEYSK